MFLEFSKFYFIKSSLKKLPKQVNDSFSYDDDLILNLASFNTLPNYFRLLNPIIKDRYNLADKLMDSSMFNKFILSALLVVKKEDKFDKLLFFYALILNHIHDKHIIPYLNAIKEPTLNINEAYNMIDFYLASKDDDLDLSSINIYKKYPNAFKILPYADMVVHDAFIRVYQQFSSQSLYLRSQKRRTFIYRFMVKPNWFNKAIYTIHDFIWRIKKECPLKCIPYHNKIDTRLLNLSHEEYEIDGIKYNKSFDEVLKEAKLEASNKINAINDYLLNKHDKSIRKEFNIPVSYNLED